MKACMSVLRFASALRFTPRGVTLVFLATAIAAMFWYGQIAQPAHYHDFADTRAWWDIPNAADVLSNLAFLAVGLWGVRLLWRWRADDRSSDLIRICDASTGDELHSLRVPAGFSNYNRKSVV